jgi:hypothetical protein
VTSSESNDSSNSSAPGSAYDSTRAAREESRSASDAGLGFFFFEREP